MYPHIKDRLIAALESGEYPKTKGRLRDETGYCCLGVLTDLYMKDLGLDWEVHSVTELGDYDDWSLLPSKVREWAGIKDEDKHIHSIGSESLARINDRNDTFEPVIERLKEL